MRTNIKITRLYEKFWNFWHITPFSTITQFKAGIRWKSRFLGRRWEWGAYVYVYICTYTYIYICYIFLYCI